MRVKFRSFALAADLVGSAEGAVELPPGATVADLMARLCELHPRLLPLAPRILTAAGVEYVPRSHALKDGDEVILIPPVSGGRSI
jgi:molybdopterin converting factor small subunit